MHRFISNRWWTFILALVLGVGVSLALPTHVVAGGGSGATLGDGAGGGGGNVPPPSGDPDVPSGSVRKPQWGGATQPMAGTYQVGAVGDGRLVTDRAWMWRLQIVMRVLRAYILRG
jgi:hypothetical protein